jgi:hypothetical protein
MTDHRWVEEFAKNLRAHFRPKVGKTWSAPVPWIAIPSRRDSCCKS